MEKNTLQTISEILSEMISSGIIIEHIVSRDPLIIQWENEMGVFKCDVDSANVYIQPKQAVQSLDFTVTILPSGVSITEG
jgi:hypothetical protein